MLPSEKFCKVIRLARFCAAVCGVDVMGESYELNVITYMLFCFIVIYFSCSVYTVVSRFDEDWTITLEVFCVVGSAFQGISKLISVLRYEDIYRAQGVFLTSVYVEYEVKNEKYVKVLDKCMQRVRLVIKLATGLYFTSFLLMLGVPLSVWALTGNRFTPMPFYMPMLDTNTNFGYMATFGVQFVIILFAVTGNFSLDMLLLVFFAHCSLCVDIFKLKAGELNELAVNFGSPAVTYKLKDIIDWHQTYSSFIENTDLIFYWITFTQITTSALSIALTLVIMMISDWPGSYVYLCLSFVIMYLYCTMGTLVQIANEYFIDEIYAIQWYVLTIEQQNAIRFMLMKAQSPKEITVGGVIPLSVSTGLQVTKTVYSFFMMLLNFLD